MEQRQRTMTLAEISEAETDQELREAVFAATCAGNTLDAVAQAAGVSRETARLWVQQGENTYLARQLRLP